MTVEQTPAAAAPISHSTFDPDFIAAEAARRYPCRGAVRAQLLYRGINDVYIVRDDDGRRALRVWRAGARSEAAVVQELEFLDFLRPRGVPVSAAEPTCTGERYFVLDAPEGPRPAALYAWAPGRKFGEQLDTAMAGRIGARFAAFHLIARDFRASQPMAVDTLQTLRDNLPFLMEWVEDRPEDRRDYQRLTETIADPLAALSGLDLPQGMCHQDMHPSNVHVDADGAITFIDFDGCAPGYWLLDVKNFVFGSEFYGFAPIYGEAFERGYATVRPFTADERANGELFLLIKAFRLIGGAARTSRSRGRDLLRFRNLDWFADYIKRRAWTLGLL